MPQIEKTIVLAEEDFQFLIDQLFARKVILKREGMHLEASAVEDLLQQINPDD